MDHALKQRLVGAIVLIALAVILIPALLDRSSDNDRLTVKMEIPPKPAGKGNNRLESRKPVEPIKVPEVKPDTKSKSKSKSESKPAPKATPPAKKTAKPSATTLKKSSSPKTDDSGRWVIQLGSFSNEANAHVLKDKFEVSGYKTYVEKGKGVAGSIYRVRIGPVDGRQKAEALRDKIKKKGNAKAIIIQYQ